MEYNVGIYNILRLFYIAWYTIIHTYFEVFGVLVLQVLAGSAEFRALNTPDKDRPNEAKEVAKLYRQLYRVSAQHAERQRGGRWGLLCFALFAVGVFALAVDAAFCSHCVRACACWRLVHVVLCAVLCCVLSCVGLG